MRAIDQVVQDTIRALLLLRGETAAQALATQLVRRIDELDDEGFDHLFRHLLDVHGADPAAIDTAIAAYSAEPSPETIADLADSTETGRLELFRTINTAPGGIACLLRLRAKLRHVVRSTPEFSPIERDLRHLLESWFNRGFLTLRQLDWQTPAHVLEKLIEYEAVHEIRGWDDLRRRLAPDRRSFGFFHPSLPNEPIIFVEVALTQGMAARISDIIDQPMIDSEQDLDFDTAIFYSITNCQRGLSGISFGNFLIKHVAMRLREELPQLTTFATLSPIPGFRRWLDDNDIEVDPENEDELIAACARFLLNARSRGMPADPVARFHLRNGSRLERINWQGDMSEKGLQESHGLLVNYRYSGQDFDANRDALEIDGIVIASDAVIDSAGDAIDKSIVDTSPSEVAELA